MEDPSFQIADGATTRDMRLRLLACASSAALSALLAAPLAQAGPLIIKQPGNHPDYKVELEPHLNLGLFHYGHRFKGYSGFGTPDFGAGFRATIKIADPAFVPKINDTVGITFGLDLGGCSGSYCHGRFHVVSPVGLQWNFYLTREWNVFADLGFMLRFTGYSGIDNGVRADFFAMAGGRYMISDKLSLTFRVGYPFVSFGVSFFAG
jgi:hypothetical protein